MDNQAVLTLSIVHPRTQRRRSEWPSQGQHSPIPSVRRIAGHLIEIVGGRHGRPTADQGYARRDRERGTTNTSYI